MAGGMVRRVGSELEGRERGVLGVERGHLRLREVGRERLVGRAAAVLPEIVRPLGEGKRLVLLPHPRREVLPRGIGPLERLRLGGREQPPELLDPECRGRLIRLLLRL